MHSHFDRIRINKPGHMQAKALIPSSICEAPAAKIQQSSVTNLKSFFEDTDAGRDAGVFFGRLIRPFGSMPSGRISGPSAEFISVTRIRSKLNFVRNLRGSDSAAVCADE